MTDDTAARILAGLLNDYGRPGGETETMAFVRFAYGAGYRDGLRERLELTRAPEAPQEPESAT